MNDARRTVLWFAIHYCWVQWNRYQCTMIVQCMATVNPQVFRLPVSAEQNMFAPLNYWSPRQFEKMLNVLSILWECARPNIHSSFFFAKMNRKSLHKKHLHEQKNKDFMCYFYLVQIDFLVANLLKLFTWMNHVWQRWNQFMMKILDYLTFLSFRPVHRIFGSN